MNAKNREDKKQDFLKMLVSVDRDQLSEFIKKKVKEHKMSKPFICLNNQ